MKHASRLDVERVAEVLAAQVFAAVNPLLKRIGELEARETAHLARIAALETRAPEKIKGDDGRGIIDALQDADGNLVLTFSDGTTRNVGKVKAADDDTEHHLRLITALASRVNDIESRKPEKGDDASDEQVARAVEQYLKAHPPADGKDADPITDDQIAAAVAQHLEAHPPKAGKDADPVSDEQIAAAVGKHLAANPPKAGKDADPISPDQIAAAVAKHLSEHPPAAGKDADPPSTEAIAKAVADYLTAHPPAPGKPGDSVKGDPGRGVKSAVIDANGELVLSFTDGELINVGRVKGTDGIDAQGKPGKDGFSADEMIATLEGERTVVIQFRRGDETKEIGRFAIPFQIQRGVYQEGRTYEHGDVVTWGGSQWHANAKTADKPGDGSTVWTLVVKKGRDGKDGVLKPPPTNAPIRLGGNGKA